MLLRVVQPRVSRSRADNFANSTICSSNRLFFIYNLDMTVFSCIGHIDIPDRALDA